MTVRESPEGLRWFPAALSVAGVLTAYVLWVLGHPYLSLGAALAGSVVSLNHYLISRRSGGVEPYWLLFLPLFLALSLYALIRDPFTAAALLYVLVIALVFASTPSNVLDSVLGNVMGASGWATAVLGAAALSGLAYLYIYGTEADPVGFWAVAGPLLEYVVLKRLILGSAHSGGPGSDASFFMYSASSSLMFLPHPLLGAYAVLINSVKGVARGRLAPALMLTDYLIRVSILAALNLGRIPVPSWELLG